MKYLCLHSLVILLLQTHVKSREPCRERIVSGAVGGAVTLHVTGTGFKNIAWSFGEKGESLAAIIPDVPIIIQDVQYNGRLNSSSNGSLIITNLQHEDQGTYRARIVTDVNQDCFYHLSVFRNLTDKDITISSDVTYDTTCEVNMTCSVNSAKKSNVTVTWRSLNSSDISVIENVVLVPPSHINFTYICTANNPVSSVFKVVLPEEYCKKYNASKEIPTLRAHTYIILAVVIVIIIIIIIVVFWIIRQKRSGSISENKEMNPLTNVYEFNDEEGAACAEAQGDKEQKPGKDRNRQNNGKGQQGPSETAVITIYDEVHPLQNGENPKVSRPTQSKEQGTAKMYKDPQAIESKESPSEDATGRTVYSVVKHTKGKNGKQSKAPKEAVSNPPTESCYSTVQLPVMDKNGRKTSSERGNSTAPEESCYEKVHHPTDKNNPKIPPMPAHWGPPKIEQKLPNKPSGPSKSSPKGANGDLPNPPVETCYAEVTLPK